MTPSLSELAEHFGQLSDEELLSRYGSESLTEEARAVAAQEMRRRGLEVPGHNASVAQGVEAEAYAGDFEIIARFFRPTDAYVLRSCLEAAGIPVLVTDDQLAQTQSLWAIAMGGARVMVPANYVADAKEIIAAFNNGSLALGEDETPE